MALDFALIIVGLVSIVSAKSEGPRLYLDKDVDSYIVGGIDANDGQWPSVLSLEYLGTNGWNHICGAVLHKDKYALTAAHCVQGYAVSNLRLLAGTLFRDNPQATDGQIVPIASYTIHPEFAPGTNGIPNNIAIITLTVPADTTHPNIKNAILPPDDINDFNHGGCFVAGFGRVDSTTGGAMSNSLQWLQIPVITNGDCKGRMAGVQSTEVLPSHICVLSDPPGNGPCNGDAGGPLYCHATEQDTSTIYIAGVFSWNVAVSGNCNLQYPSVSNRVSKYLDWIEANTP